ncbi:amidase-like protein [Penicillium herquei]|nr:amidase-like protein [Penicillium herquei]
MGQFYSLQVPLYKKLSRDPRLVDQPVTQITKFDLFKHPAARKSSVLLETAIGSNENQQYRVSTVIETDSAAFIVEQYPRDPLKLSATAVLAPLAVLLVRDNQLTTKYVGELIHEYLREDDVLCSEFLSTKIFVTEQDDVDEEVLLCLASFGCKTLYLLPTTYSLTKGPYFYSCEGLFRTSRLYPDTQEAFVLSTVPSQNDKNLYMNLNASSYGATTLCVAVPSRHYFTPSAEFPLAGLRVAVKDMFHLRGVRTTCGNRAYADLYGNQDVTSATVQKLIDHGAIIVGKTKTAEFAGSQEVIGDLADFSYAFNPRADGYLRCTGSSTGSASGIASYPWLDVGLGSDAGGSVRDPAIHHGIFGFRPSHDGSAEPNTPLPCEARQIYRPKHVLYLEEYGSDRKDVQEIFENVISQFSKWLGTETIHLSLESLWKETNSIGTSESFSDYFKTTFMEVLASDYESHESQFLQEYQQKFKSAPNLGASITSAQKQAATEKVRLHNSWFTKHVLSGNENVIVIPRYNLQYRDDYLGPPEDREFFGFDSNLHATFAGLPELVVPSM